MQWLMSLVFPFIFFRFFSKKYLFIWLHWVLIAAYGIFDLRCGLWDPVPWPGIESWPPWECRVLVTGPLGKFPTCDLNLKPEGFLTLFPPPGPAWTNRDTGSGRTPRLPGEYSQLCGPLDPLWEGTVFSTGTQAPTYLNSSCLLVSVHLLSRKPCL